MDMLADETSEPKLDLLVAYRIAILSKLNFKSKKVFFELSKCSLVQGLQGQGARIELLNNNNTTYCHLILCECLPRDPSHAITFRSHRRVTPLPRPALTKIFQIFHHLPTTTTWVPTNTWKSFKERSNQM